MADGEIEAGRAGGENETSGGGLSRRLGFGPDDVVAVIHCDDIGMCDAANRGAFEALEAGPATCGSLMVPCPAFDEAAAYVRGRQDLDLGVHLTLNCEHDGHRWGPVVGRERAPSLCAPDGGLWKTSAETAAHARPEEVELELRAQIERALEAGIDVTHVDAHMGTAFLPPFLPVYEKLILEFDVAAFVARPTPQQVAALGPVLEPILAAVDRLESRGVPLLDGFDSDSLDFEPGRGEAHNRARLAGFGPGVHYLICHPASGGEELDRITPGDAHARDFERRFYGGAAGHEALAAAGVQTLGMRPLRDLVRSAR